MTKWLLSASLVAGLLSLFAVYAKTESDKLADIVVLEQGQSTRTDEITKKLCREFHVSTEDVANFYRYSRSTSEQELHDEYDLLPCYAKGTVKINGLAQEWLIRAGGTGYFANKDTLSLRVCEKSCCEHFKELC